MIARFRDGDKSAFNAIITQWEQPIYNFVYRQVRHHEDAQDLVQRIFVKAYEKLDLLRDDTRFKSWLYSIALNLCRDEFRRNKNKQHISFDDYESIPAMKGLNNNCPADEEDNSGPSNLHKKEVCKLIEQALDQIPVEQREIVILKELQELKFTEIAEVLNLPVNTVKSRMY